MSQSRHWKSRNAPRQSRRGWMITGVVTAVIAGGFWLWLDGRGAAKRSGPAIATRPLSTASVPDSEIFGQFARSANCKSCHPEYWKLWEESNHALAERPLDPRLDGSAFDVSAPIHHGSLTSAVQRVVGKFQIVTVGESGQRQPFTADRVIGHVPLRQFLISGSNGRMQVSELAFDPQSGEWFDVFGNEDRRPGEWGHWTGRGMTWNQMCATCHNTRLRKHYDSAADRYHTTMAEPAIGCESCHGPMADHVKWQGDYGQRGRRDPTIRRLNREQMLAACGACHARRGELTGEFQPGDQFSDHFQLTIPDETDLYYADGQVRDENYEFTSFLSSRMFASGVSCSDCHEPHSAKLRATDNSLCQRCHEAPVAPAPKIDALTHSRHAPGSKGDRCVDCHMPLTTYMQRHPRRDHGFTIPDPLLTKRHGIPNACNRCHTNRDADWALAAVEEWFGPRMGRPTRERAMTIAKARQGSREAVPALTKLAREEKVGLWRAAAVRLLEPWAAEPEVTAALLDRAGDSDPLVRAEVTHALATAHASGAAKTGDSLASLLNDPVRAPRVGAAWALHRSVDTNSVAGRELFESLIFNSDQPAGSARMGVFLMDRGDLLPALGYWERAVEWDGNSAALRDGLAVCLSLLGRADESVAQLKEACRLEPRDAHYRYKLGLALNEMGKLHEAVAALEEAVKLDSRLAAASYNLGLGYAALERLDEAVDALTKSESSDPQSARIPYARATVLARLGKLNEARVAAQRALELDPQLSDAAVLLQQLR